MLHLQLPSPIQELEAPFLTEKGVRLFIKREDLIDPIISGNKWRKLKYNLLKAKERGHTTILSFGGAYSNHIHALAKAASLEGLKSIGIIRGEEFKDNLNPTLKDAKAFGMELIFVSREEYKQKETLTFIDKLRQTHGDFYLIPEGGKNSEGAKGCQEIIDEITTPYNYICLPCGTGTTMAGLVSNLPKDKQAIGFPALKGGEFLEKDIRDLLTEEKNNWHLETAYHFGGYGKWNQVLIEFISDFETQFHIPLDQVYTGKMMFGLFDLIKKNNFPKGASIIALHTGGLQGKR